MTSPIMMANWALNRGASQSKLILLKLTFAKHAAFDALDSTARAPKKSPANCRAFLDRLSVASLREHTPQCAINRFDDLVDVVFFGDQCR